MEFGKRAGWRKTGDAWFFLAFFEPQTFIRQRKEIMRDLARRTKNFAIDVISFAETLPRSTAGITIRRQLIRSGSSVGANYCEASRAESMKNFIHKIALAEKEAAETLYWLGLCRDTSIGSLQRLEPLQKESDELVAIFTTIGRKSKQRLQKK